VSPASVTFPSYDEGAPGPELLGTGDRRTLSQLVQESLDLEGER